MQPRPFRDGLSSVGSELLLATSVPDLKSLRASIMKIQKARQYVEIWVVWGLRLRQIAYDFLFDFNRNYASTLHHFQVIASYLF